MSNFIQHFFWSCAGVDTEVLEQCPSDQRKYTSIGVIIFLVASFASLAMYFAASTIVESKLAAIGIAILWGIMILMLDRLIVSTIKNDADTTNRKKWIAAIPRIVLAAIIAIVISRPIEVQIFSKEIIKQIKEDEILAYNNINKNLTSNSNLNLLTSVDTNLINRANSVESYLEQENISTGTFRRLQSELRTADSRLVEVSRRKRQKDYRGALEGLNKISRASESDDNYYKTTSTWVQNANNTQSPVDIRTLKPNWITLRTVWKKRVNEVNRKVREATRAQSRVIRRMETEKNRYQDSIKTVVADINKVRDSIQLKKLRENDRIKQKLNEYSNSRKDSIPSFFTQMKALSNLGYETDDFGNQTDTNLFWWAKWFILLLFFVVEISPVFVKIISPAGAYDEAFQKKQYSDQQIFKDNLDAKAEVADIHRENWKKEQRKIYQNKKESNLKIEQQDEDVIEN